MLRRNVAVGVGLVLVFLGACVSDEPSGSSDNSDGGGSDGSSGDGSTANAPPTHAAQGVSFVDVDPKVGTLGGTVRIQKANDESDVSAYVVYFGTDATHKSSPTPVTTLSATGKNLSYKIADGTAPQPGVTTLLVYTQNAAGEMSAGVSTPFTDATPHNVAFADADAGYLGGGTRIAFDETNRKLLIATSSLALFRCELDGTGCVKTDISQGHDTVNNTDLGLTIDPDGKKVLAVAAAHFLDGGGGVLPALFSANLDGSSPAFADISAGQSPDVGDGPTVTIDTTRQKLMVVGQDLKIGDQGQPVLFECHLDGSSCTFRDLLPGTGEGANSGAAPSAVVDPVGANLLVVTTDIANHGNPTLWICPLAGGNCSTEDVSASLGTNGNGETPTILLDATSNKIDVVSTTSGSSRPLFFQCNTDGSNCLAADLTTGTPAGDNSAQAASAVLDTLDGKIGVLTQDRNASFRPALFRCNADGTGCTYTDLSGAATFSTTKPVITVDPETGQFFGIAERIDDSSYTPSLFFLK